MCSLEGTILFYLKVLIVHPAYKGVEGGLSYTAIILNWIDCEWQGCILLAQTESEGLHTKLSFWPWGLQRAGTVMFDLDLLDPGRLCFWHTA